MSDSEKPIVIIRTAKNCEVCKDMIRIGQIDSITKALEKDYKVIPSHVDFKEIGDPKSPALLNYPLMAPYFMVMLPETLRLAKTQGTRLSDVVHHVRIFNGMVGPDGAFKKNPIYGSYDDVPKFCAEAVKSLKGMPAGPSEIIVEQVYPGSRSRSSKANFRS